jgi:Glucose-6-phosphate dehydrogenase, NAD binding domain
MSEQLYDFFGDIFQRYFRPAMAAYPWTGGALVGRLFALSDVPDRLAQTRCAAIAWGEAETGNATIASELFVITQDGLMYAAGFEESPRRALYYLATPSALFDPFVDQVEANRPHQDAVVAVDGRFGRELAAAHPMDAALRHILDEHHALRVDLPA